MENGRLVAGLGNPGAQYAATRHNAGFMVVDELFSRHGGTTWQEKWKGEFSRIRIGVGPVVLLKPLTFMNLSGRSVARAAVFHQFEPGSLVVVHDDLDLELGTVRVKVGGGTGGHKGLNSLKAELGSADFVRVRVGIGRPVHGTATEFVLQRFRPDEMPILTNVIARAADAVESVIEHGTNRAMNEFNQRGGETDEP
jgi:PTH1 family peptidyl-tRNA hydrolase